MKENGYKYIAAFISLFIHGSIIIILLITSKIDNFFSSDNGLQKENFTQLKLVNVPPVNISQIPLEEIKKTIQEKNKQTVTIEKKEKIKEIPTPEEKEEIKKDEIKKEEIKKDSVPLAERKDTIIPKLEMLALSEIQKDTIQDTLIANLLDSVAKNKDITPKNKTYAIEDNNQFYRKNQKTIRNLMKVYPYAVKTRDIVDSLNMQLASVTDKREKRKLIKQKEKELFDNFEKDIRSMTVSQGKILLKLIARETDKSAYELIKEYKGSIPAAFWQGVARLFDENLKVKYDSINEDKLLETIIHKYHVDKKKEQL